MKTLLAAFALVSMAAAAAVAQETAQLPPDDENAIVEYGGPDALTIVSGDAEHAFTVEIADNIRNRARGMMFRDSVGDDEGMLFVYPEDQTVSIWMKNVRISLDILFVESDGTIAKIAHRAIPYSLRSMSSEIPVRAVLELGGGRAAALGIAPGDKVVHPALSGSDAEG